MQQNTVKEDHLARHGNEPTLDEVTDAEDEDLLNLEVIWKTLRGYVPGCITHELEKRAYPRLYTP